MSFYARHRVKLFAGLAMLNFVLAYLNALDESYEHAFFSFGVSLLCAWTAFRPPSFIKDWRDSDDGV